MNSEIPVLAGLAAEMRGMSAQLARHVQSVEEISKSHDKIITELASIKAILGMTGSPVDAAVRLANLEAAQRSHGTFMNAVVAAFGLAIASIAALIAGIIQALGGPGPKHPGGG